MEMEVVKTLLWAIGGLLSCLVIVIGWIGLRIHARLDSISVSLSAIEKDLREDLTSLDRRLTVLETRSEGCGVRSVCRTE
jgi:hypothetical protein